MIKYKTNLANRDMIDRILRGQELTIESAARVLIQRSPTLCLRDAIEQIQSKDEPYMTACDILEEAAHA